jgi:acyl carrier protein
MTISNFLQKLSNVFDETDISDLKPETIFRDIEEWDSLTALTLIAMVDEEYSVKLTGDDIKSSKTLNDIFEVIKNKK